jgi:hypothetical protein
MTIVYQVESIRPLRSAVVCETVGSRAPTGHGGGGAVGMCSYLQAPSPFTVDREQRRAVSYGSKGCRRIDVP